jgi:hypothetical protein
MRFQIVNLAVILAWTAFGQHGRLKAQTITPGPAVKVSAQGTTAQGQLKQRITVIVENLSAWIKPGNDPAKLQLVLDGRVLKGVTADYLGKNSSTLKFDLTQNADNRDAWTALLRTSRGAEVPLSVALPGNPAFPTDAMFKLIVYPTLLTVGVILLLIALLVVFLVLAIRSDIIRDPGPEPAPGDRRYFSLARSQMAWWFFVVVAAYLYIALVTGNYDTLNPSVLALIGISAATGLASMAIDASQNGAAQDRQKTLAAERVSVEARIAQLEKDTSAGQPHSAAILQDSPPPPNLDDLKKELANKKGRQLEIQAAIDALPPPERPKSQGFLHDILKDDSGVTFHRFQIAAWTIVLGGIFVRSVLQDLAMPDFNATLLGLMGISSGTYIGFKFPGATP